MGGNLRRGQPRGGQHPCARLTEEQVVAIRTRVAAGESQQTLALEFGLSASTVSRICSGKLWSHLPVEPTSRKRKGSSHPRSKLKESDIPVILLRLERKDPLRKVAADYGVSPATIYKVGRRQTWRHVKRPIQRKRVWER